MTESLAVVRRVTKLMSLPPPSSARVFFVDLEGSPLGAPAIYGVPFRVTDADKAETVFRRFGLLRPLTDREVPPTLQRSLPTDQTPDPVLSGDGNAHAATSVAPPDLG